MNRRTTRRGVLAGGAALSLSLAGCLGLGGGGGSGSSDGSDSTAPTTERGTTGSAGTAAGTDTETDAAASTADPDAGPPTADATLPVAYDRGDLREAVRSGGPGKDGIPSIDEPTFESASAAADRMVDGEVVFGVVGPDGEAKAYPQYVLVWHEIVNDRLGDRPVSVTYCPLTGTAMGFERGETTFGVSGNLLNSNLVMYDRATDSRWPQMLGTAIEGVHEGAALREFRLVWTSWADWRDAHPETLVLTEDTGYARRYGSDPYGQYNPPRGYYSEDSTLFPPLTADDRLDAKAVVLGVRTGDAGPAAFSAASLRERGLLRTDVDGADGGAPPLLAVYDPALGTAYAYRNPDGAAFEYRNGTVVDAEGTEHAPADLPLDRVYGYDAMWFAWAGFYPETPLYE